MVEKSASSRVEKLFAVKGMNDILPPDSAQWEWFEEQVRTQMAIFNRPQSYQVAQAGVPLSALAPNAPDEYVVKPRDFVQMTSKMRPALPLLRRSTT